MIKRSLQAMLAVIETLRSVACTVTTKRAKIVRAFSFFYLIYLLCCLFLTRTNTLLGFQRLDAFYCYYEYLLGLVALLIGLMCYRRFTLLLLLFAAASLIHSFVSFYGPSLKFNTPLEDYFLTRGVTANWSMARAEYFVWIFTTQLLMARAFILSFNFMTAYEKTKLKALTFFAIFIHISVALVQTFMDSGFLSEGSGSALAVGRFPSLLEDSGASTIFFSLTFVYLVCGNFSNSNLLKSILRSIALIIIFILGLYGLGRTFLVTAALFVIVKLFASLLVETNKFKLKRILVGAVITLSALFAVIHTFGDTKGLSNIKDTIDGVLEGKGHLVDRTRYTHIIASKWGIDRSFPEGMGLGSFDALLGGFFTSKSFKYQRMNRTYDWPTNFYLQLIAEYGFAGCVMLLLLFVFFIKAALNYKRSNLVKIGLLAYIFMSWFVGLHFIFRSIAPLFALVLASNISDLKSSKSIRFLFIICICALFIQSLSKGIENKNQTSFWSSYNHKYYGVNRFRESIQDKPGQWLVSGSEFVVTDDVVKFYIKHPAKYYPIKLKVVIYSAKDEEIWSNDLLIEKESSFMLEPTNLDKCADLENGHNCYAKVHLSKEWKWDGRKMGVFLFD